MENIEAKIMNDMDFFCGEANEKEALLNTLKALRGLTYAQAQHVLEHAQRITTSAVFWEK